MHLQDSKKKREEERQKQLRWREENRNALIKGHDTLLSGADTLTREALMSNGRFAPQLPGYTMSSAVPALVIAGAQAFRQKRWRKTDAAAPATSKQVSFYLLCFYCCLKL